MAKPNAQTHQGLPGSSPSKISPRDYFGNYVAVPKVIRQAINHDPAIPSGYRGELARFIQLVAAEAYQNGYCCLSVAQIVEDLNVSESTARRIAHLAAKTGYVQADIQSGKITKYTIPWAFDEQFLRHKDEQVKAWRKQSALGSDDLQPLSAVTEVTPVSRDTPTPVSRDRGCKENPCQPCQGSNSHPVNNKGLTSSFKNKKEEVQQQEAKKLPLLVSDSRDAESTRELTADETAVIAKAELIAGPRMKTVVRKAILDGHAPERILEIVRESANKDSPSAWVTVTIANRSKDEGGKLTAIQESPRPPDRILSAEDEALRRDGRERIRRTRENAAAAKLVSATNGRRP